MLLVALLTTLHLQAETCVIPHEVFAEQDFATFDQTEAGWRHLARAECYAAAAEAINAYRAHHGASLDPARLSGLEWHEGQMYAHIGRYDAAREMFAATYDTHQENPSMLAKIDANIAFLDRDYSALLEARERLASIPKPEGFEAAAADYAERFPDHEPLEWPLNLDIVDRFIRCFESDYATAYRGRC
jgi:hypothetical protein